MLRTQSLSASAPPSPEDLPLERFGADQLGALAGRRLGAAFHHALVPVELPVRTAAVHAAAADDAEYVEDLRGSVDVCNRKGPGGWMV